MAPIGPPWAMGSEVMVETWPFKGVLAGETCDGPELPRPPFVKAPEVAEAEVTVETGLAGAAKDETGDSLRSVAIDEVGVWDASMDSCASGSVLNLGEVSDASFDASWGVCSCGVCA